MMTDDALVNAAAKAANLKFRVSSDWHDKGQWLVGENYWNPLADDGDALRLAVRLRMSVCVEVDQTWVCVAGMPSRPLAFEWHAQDPSAATRRVIVRAAAAMTDA